ncbi:hypothetical protein BJX65DRAFT_292734 [Aspergillus insuetus]
MDDTPWLQTANQVLVAVGLAVCTSCLLMRIYTKAFIMKRFWWDDVFIIIAWLSFSLTESADKTRVDGFSHAGLGVHITELSPSTLITLQKIVLACSIVYLYCLGFAKIALLVLYHRILSPIRAWAYTIYFVGFIIVGYTIALTLALFFACNPLDKNWNPFIVGGSCINRPGVYLATAATNTVSDVVLILIPVNVVWRLRMGWMRKLGAICMFGIGGLTIITSIIRLATLWPLLSSKDISRDLALVCTFVIVEANFIILCGSMPFFRQFIRYYGPKWFPGWWSARNNISNSIQDSSSNPPVGFVQDPRVGIGIGIVSDEDEDNDDVRVHGDEGGSRI